MVNGEAGGGNLARFAPNVQVVNRSRPNVPHQQIARNIGSSRSRGYPEVASKWADDNGRKVAIVGSGPSLEKNHLLLHDWDGDIFACNGAARWLRDHDIVPTAFVMTDAMDDMVGYVDSRLTETTHYFGSMVSPDVFDRLDEYGLPVMLWHVLNNWPSDPRDRVKIGNGPTVVCRSACLAIWLGYRDISFFGCEGSFPTESADGRLSGHVAMGHRRDEDAAIATVNGEAFLTLPQLARQAYHLRSLADHTRGRVRFAVYGEGMLGAYMAPKVLPDFKMHFSKEQAERFKRQPAPES